jgi:hypothetical protein
LETTYAGVDIQFLQEVAGAFIAKSEKKKLATEVRIKQSLL